MLPTVTGAAKSPPSAALLAANQRLLAQRAGRAGQTADAAVSNRASADANRLATISLADVVVSLPPHLGWDSQAATAARRGRAQPTTQAAPDIPPADRPTAPSSTPPAEATMTLAPDLALALLQTGQTAAGRLWLVCRALDSSGRGWLPMAQVRAHLTERRSPWRVCGQRRLRQLLQSGTGLFWERDDRDRLWLYGAARVAAGLGVTRLRQRPVRFPCAALLGPLGTVRAQLYATFHSGRLRRDLSRTRRTTGATHPPQGWGAPISRATLTRLTGTPARTQRLYERRLGLPRRANYALGSRLTTEEWQERCWQQGRGVFVWRDAAGRHGRPGHRYVAWRLPNSYGCWHEPAPRGRYRKINQALQRPSDLVHDRAQGNGESGQRSGRIFHPQGSAAGRAFNRAPQQDHYWPAASSGRAGVWYALSVRSAELTSKPAGGNDLPE